jgi:adenylate kinase family enzyme/YHS domain-containing protein
MIERSLVLPLGKKELPFYETSFTYRPSKFGFNSPISISNPCKTRAHAVQYRERIYYLSDEEERANFLKQPSKYTKGVESIPLDIPYKPFACVIGYPRSGKSTLCQKISENTGAVHIQLDEVIQMFIGNDSQHSENLRNNMMMEGRGIDDLTMVQLLLKRIQMPDCVMNGFVIEDFPRTKTQAVIMARNGLKPWNVFNVKIPLEEVYKRTYADKDTEFGCMRNILA